MTIDTDTGVQITSIDVEDISLPAPKESIDQELATIKRVIIKNNAVVITSTEEGNSSCFTGIKLEGVKATCGFTNDADAQVFIAEQPDENITDGAIFTSALAEHIFAEAELNQGTSVGDGHLDTLSCLSALSDTEELVTTRLMNHQNNKDQWPSLRNKIMKNVPPIDEPQELHHLEPQAEAPEKTLDPKNVAPKPQSTHKKGHSLKRKESAEEMKKIKVANPNEIINKNIK